MNRKGFIGSTDTCTIMGTTNYSTYNELWRVKTGRQEPEDLSNALPVQLGVHTESFNLNWFSKQTNMILDNHQKHYAKKIEGIPCQTYIDAKCKTGIVEAKHTNAFTNMDEQLAKYMPQLQFNMHLANTKLSHLSIIFGNMKWESVTVGYDKDYFNNIMKEISRFWDYVEQDIEPPNYHAMPIETNSIPIDDMVSRDASSDNEFVSMSMEYLFHQAGAKEFETAKKRLKAIVKPTEREVYTDLLSVKRSKNGSLRFYEPKE